MASIDELAALEASFTSAHESWIYWEDQKEEIGIEIARLQSDLDGLNETYELAGSNAQEMYDEYLQFKTEYDFMKQDLSGDS